MMMRRLFKTDGVSLKEVKMFTLGLMAISYGLKLFGQNKESQKQKDTEDQTAKEEQDAINAKNSELHQESLQPAMIQVRQQQEQINQQISNANSPYTNAINFSTLGGLKGKLGA
jgi:hypothetical protein